MLRVILIKEFRQIFRNPNILRIMLMMPIMQLILIPLAADYEVKNVNIAIIDQDRSSYSQRLTHKLEASPYLTLSLYTHHYVQARELVSQNETDLILTIPAGFERNLVREGSTKVHLAADAINGVKAGLGSVYASNIIADFNRDIRESWVQAPRAAEAPQIEVLTVNRYNPLIEYSLFMVPGILALLVTMVGSMMSALNIVHEKEIGTIEQLNVTPIRKWQFLLGKLVPFWVLGLVTLTIGMIIGRILYGVTPIGNLGVLYLFSGVYLVGTLGLGLLISTFVDTQQQVTLVSFFVMMLFVLMGGLYTPVDSMPSWAAGISRFIPVSHFINVVRAIVLKGSTLLDLRHEMFWLLTFAVGFNALAIFNYRKRVA